MEIEVLYFDGCSSWEEGLANLTKALEEEHLQDKIRMVRVPNQPEAELFHFLGSPSFRLNGQDLWPEDRQHYNLSCRVYKTPQGLRGAPTVDMLREKLRAHS